MASPQRTCVGCGARRTTEALIRVAIGADGELAVGRELPGRGAWLCGTAPAACALRATRRRRWTTALRRPVGNEQAARLVARLGGDGQAHSAGNGSPSR